MKYKSAVVVKNEAHQLKPEQEMILGKGYGSKVVVDVPSRGLNLDEMRGLGESLYLRLQQGWDVVMVSPIPALMLLAYHAHDTLGDLLVFHNDKRKGKEVAETGWVLLSPTAFIRE